MTLKINKGLLEMIAKSANLSYTAGAGYSFLPCLDFSFFESDNHCERCGAKEKLCQYLNENVLGLVEVDVKIDKDKNGVETKTLRMVKKK